MIKLFVFGVIIGVGISTCSCSLEKRAQRHIRKAISLDPSILEKDTITFTDSVHVITKEVTHDSVFQISKDTVTIVKDNLTIKHFISKDSVYIYGECAGDTIIEWRTHEVPTEHVIVRDDDGWKPPNWFWLMVFLAGFVYGVEKYFRHRRNK